MMWLIWLVFKISVKSFGMAFLIEASAAPVISQDDRTSHIARWWQSRKLRRSVIAAEISGELFGCARVSHKTSGITLQNLFCGCM